jgi:hypothetical protein
MLEDLTDMYETYFFPNTLDGSGKFWATIQSSFPTYNTSRGEPWLDLATNRWVGAGLDLYSHTGFVMDNVANDKMDRVMTRFLEVYKPNRQLAGLKIAKGPDNQLIVYGLLDLDPGRLAGTEHATTEAQLREYADVLVNSIIRDTVKSEDFSEVLEEGGGIGDPVLATGVRPSLFSLVNFVDFVWIANGYRMDEGNLAFTHLPGRQGGVTGLTYLGEPMDVDIDGDTITVTSEALGGEVVLDAVAGQTVRITSGAPAGPELQVSATARCVAGKAQLSVAVKNLEEGSEVDVAVASTALGSKQFTGVQPGKSVSVVFATRATALAGGEVTVSGTLLPDGQPVSDVFEYQPVGCR